MDRYYISIPDPSPPPNDSTQFRKDQFIDVVRMILCAFYEDSEIMVVNFLLESDIAHTDQQIAESLGIPQRQVRAILEARLCKDFITEAEIPNSGLQGQGSQSNPYVGGASAWYRMCPDVLSATWYRLSQTERAIHDNLKSVQETESYVCERCGGREFDALRAVSLYSQTDGLFHCDICDDILQMRENKQVRERIEGLLVEFYTRFELLKERLESMSKMVVPRPIVIKKTVHEKLLEQARKDAEAQQAGRSGPSGATFSQFNAAISNLVTSGPMPSSRPVTASAPEWIRRAQSVGDASIRDLEGVGLESGAPATNGLESIFNVKRVKTELKTEVVDRYMPDVRFVIESAQIGKKEEIKEEREDALVSVGGIQYRLSEVRENEGLIDRMTDQEYSQYDSLVQSIFGMR